MLCSWGTLMLLRILDRLEEILIATLMAAATLDHLHRGDAPLSDRHSLAVSDPVSDQPVLGAGTVHLHVRVGRQVRRGLWRAHRHPCRRRRRGEPAQVALAQCGGAVRPVLRRVLHRRDRHHGREIRLWADAHRPGLARSRDPELVRLSLHSARLLSDVLPLPAGRVPLLGVTGELPHHDHAHVEGVEVEEPGIGAAGVTR